MRQDATTADGVLSARAAGASPVARLRAIWDHGDIPLLCDVPIRLRFGLLVGLAVLGALAFGGAYVLAERRIDAELVAQDGYRRLNDLAGDVRAKAAALRNHEELFLRQRDPALATAFRQDAAFVARSLDAMAGLPEAASMQGQVGELRVGFAAAATRFDAVAAQVEALGLTDSSGLRGRLAESVKAVEDELKMWPNAGSLLPTMLQMRQAEKNFMLYGGESALGVHRKYLNQFDFELDASALPASTRDDLRKLARAYADDMQAFAAGTLALESEARELRQTFQAVQPVLTQVFSYAREGMTEAIRRQEAVRRQTSGLVAVFGLVAVASFFAAALVLARSITRPVRLIEAAMNRLAKGDHAVTVPGIARKDEIGDMAKAVAVFKDNAIAMVRMQQEQQAIRAEAEAAGRARMLALAEHFERAVKSVADAIAANALSIRDTAEGMARGEDGDSRSLVVAEAAAQARHTVAAVAEATVELSASVGEISRHAGESSAIVRDAVAELERTNTRVQGLTQLAGDIDRVVTLIGDIAARTNMLSLNATIEAQRAGEAGKGFAVVAGEVKRLAHQTSESAAEIAAQVAAIQAATADTVGAIAEVGAAIRRMDGIAGDVARAVNHQVVITDRIGTCVDEVTRATTAVTDGVVRVTQSAARYCGTAIEVMWAADDLARPAAALRQEVDEFLRTVRA